MPPGYHSAATGPPTAYQAVKRGAGVRDLSAEGRLGVSGADRADWLQGLVTNDVKALESGRGCYAAYLTPQGRMLSDMRILALDEAFLMDVPATNVPLLRERLEQFIITEDVRLWDRTNELGRLAVHGPDSPRVLAQVLETTEPIDPEQLASLSEHQHRRARWLDTDLVIAGSNDLGTRGFDVYLPPPRLPQLEAALLEAGASRVDEATWHTLRVEAGRPLFGVDMSEETIPLEAGIEHRAISLTKGCYVGQEVIIRVLHRGHGRVARRLVRLIEETGEGPSDRGPDAIAPPQEAGSEPQDVPRFTRDAVIAAGDREVGRVTSAAWSPDAGRSVGLGYVRREFAESGTRLTVLSRNEHVEITVASL